MNRFCLARVPLTRIASAVFACVLCMTLGSTTVLTSEPAFAAGGQTRAENAGVDAGVAPNTVSVTTNAIPPMTALPDTTPALSIHDANEGGYYGESGPMDDWDASGVVGSQGASGAVNTQSDDGTDNGINAEEPLPSSYSSVDAGNVTPVRDQGPFGTCWAFSTIAAIESSLLAHGQAQVDTLDLSERQLAYFMYHEALDPLGYTAGDSTKPNVAEYGDNWPEGDTYLNVGGNPTMAMNLLASWRGVVDESDASYDDLVDAYWRYHYPDQTGDDSEDASNADGDSSDSSQQFLTETALSDDLAYERDSWHVSGTYQISLRDLDDVKRAVMKYGGAAFLMYFDGCYANYQENNVSYYNYETNDTNHVVTVVGWDDNYSADNFETDYSWVIEYGLDPAQRKEEAGNRTKKPDRDGAWLVKNSSGSWWGNGGYFWLSYQDVCANGFFSKVHVYDAETADNHDNIYQHDGSTGLNSASLASGGSIANVYTAKANAEGAEVLEAVSFALEDVNVDYSVQVFLNLRDTNGVVTDPTNGSPALSRPVTGKTSYAGYYTVSLPKPVPLAPQTKYSVVITLSHADGRGVGYFVDRDDNGWDWTSMVSAAHPGESFAFDPTVKLKGGSGSIYFDDLAIRQDVHPCEQKLDYPQYTYVTDETDCVARVKAFTRNVALDELPSLTLGDATVSLGSPVGQASYAFTGSAVEPPVAVTFGGAPLVEGIDYQALFTNNVSVGTAEVTVVGLGVYEGSLTQTFEIAPARLSKSDLGLAAAKRTYTGKTLLPDIEVVHKGQKLQKNVDYSLSYRDEKGAAIRASSVKKAGKYKVVVEGKGNYAGVASVAYCITRAANPMKLAVKTKSVLFERLKSANCKVSGAIVFKTRAKGKVTYAKVAKGSSKRLSIAKKTGKITVKRGTKCGVYKIRVKVRAAGDANHKSMTKTVTCKVRVV